MADTLVSRSVSGALAVAGRWPPLPTVPKEGNGGRGGLSRMKSGEARRGPPYNPSAKRTLLHFDAEGSGEGPGAPKVPICNAPDPDPAPVAYTTPLKLKPSPDGPRRAGKGPQARAREKQSAAPRSTENQGKAAVLPLFAISLANRYTRKAAILRHNAKDIANASRFENP